MSRDQTPWRMTCTRHRSHAVTLERGIPVEGCDDLIRSKSWRSGVSALEGLEDAAFVVLSKSAGMRAISLHEDGLGKIAKAAGFLDYPCRCTGRPHNFPRTAMVALSVVSPCQGPVRGIQERTAQNVTRAPRSPHLASYKIWCCSSADYDFLLNQLITLCESSLPSALYIFSATNATTTTIDPRYFHSQSI